MELHLNKKFSLQRNHQLNEEATTDMEKIFANNIWQGINIQNIQRTHTTERQNIIKMGRRSEYTIF